MSLVVRLLCLAMLLALLPILVWVFGWHWQISQSLGEHQPWFWLTLTGSFPFALLTTAAVLLFLNWRLKWSRQQLLRHGACLLLALLAGAGVKSYLKWHFKESRPYVQYLDKTHNADFYQDSATQQRQLIDESPIPQWLKRHWRAERGYSLPSGHSQFAASLALYAGVLLWLAGAWGSLLLVLAWALVVMGSRLLLGMHWPGDLLLSIILSCLLIWPALRLGSGKAVS